MFANTVLHPILAASDLERAKRWYSQKLGLEPVNEDNYGSARYETGDSMFLVYQSEFAGTNKATAAGFRVEDFDVAVAALRENHVVFEDVDFGPMGSTVDGVMTSPNGVDRIAWFKDSEGNILAVTTMG